jgi:trigger factor
MSVTKNITRLEKSAVRLEVTIPRDDLRAEYEKAVNEISKTIQIAGFRKGKVPRNVIERKLGAALKEDVLNSIVGEAVKNIVEDEAFPKEDQPLANSQPVLEGDAPKLDLDNDLTFSVTWDAPPVVKVETWKGLTAEVAEVVLDDEDVARELERIRERNAVVMDRQPEDPAQNGDVLTVNYAELNDAGNEIPGSTREGFVFTLGSKGNIYQFDEELVGMKAGERKAFTKDFPADYDIPELARKLKKIAVTVTAVKEKKLPDLDDDFAQDVDEKFKTLDDLKKWLRENMDRRLEEHLHERRVAAIMDQIIEKNPVDLPESMVATQMEAQFMNLCQQAGMPDEHIARVSRDENHSFRKVVELQRPKIIKSLQSMLIRLKLVEDLKIEVTDDDRRAAFEKSVEQEGLTIEQIEQYYEQDDRRKGLDDYLKLKKLEDMLLKENTVNTGAKQSYKDYTEGAHSE